MASEIPTPAESPSETARQGFGGGRLSEKYLTCNVALLVALPSRVAAAKLIQGDWLAAGAAF